MNTYLAFEFQLVRQFDPAQVVSSVLARRGLNPQPLPPKERYGLIVRR